MTYTRKQKDRDIINKGNLVNENLRHWIGEVFYGDGNLGFHLPSDAFDLWTKEVIDSNNKTDELKIKRMILIKIIHTVEVIQAGLDIMTRTGEVDWDQYKVCTACLLHDIGRFPQALLGSYSDLETEFDHALEGALIVERAELTEMIGMGVDKHTIIEAVKMHSRIDYDGDNNYVKLTRDADKLALLRYAAEWVRSDLLPSGPVSNGVIETYKRGELIKNADRISQADFLISLLSWENDFNFQATKMAFVDEGTKDWLLSQLKNEGVVL